MFKLLVTPLLVLVAVVFSAQSTASLIQVRFDDFIDPVANTTVFSANGFTINRTIAMTGGGAFGGGTAGIIGVGSLTLNYTILAAPGNDLTFNNLFNFYKAGAPPSPKGTINPSASGIFDGFSFDVMTAGASGRTFEYSYNGGFSYFPAQAITSSGLYSQHPGGNTSNFSLRLTQTSTGAILAIQTVNAVAVPEPTALLLVASALGGLIVRRRRN